MLLVMVRMVRMLMVMAVFCPQQGPPGPRVSSHYSHRPPVSQGSVTLVKRIASWKYLRCFDPVQVLIQCEADFNQGKRNSPPSLWCSMECRLVLTGVDTRDRDRQKRFQVPRLLFTARSDHQLPGQRVGWRLFRLQTDRRSSNKPPPLLTSCYSSPILCSLHTRNVRTTEPTIISRNEKPTDDQVGDDHYEW